MPQGVPKKPLTTIAASRAPRLPLQRTRPRVHPPLQRESARSRWVQLAMHTSSNWSLLSAHHLVFQVQALIERAQSHVILITPYIDLWPSLELVMRQSIERGVEVHVVTRTKDDTHFEKCEGRRTGSLARIKALGAALHEIEWLHTKLYLNEQEAIVSSFNLTATGRDGPNLGVHLQGAEAAALALRQVDQWLPGFSDQPRRGSTAASTSRRDSAFCIRCNKPCATFNIGKPYCGECWRDRRSEREYKAEACCHRCGQSATTDLYRPTCSKCATNTAGVGTSRN